MKESRPKDGACHTKSGREIQNPSHLTSHTEISVTWKSSSILTPTQGTSKYRKAKGPE